MTSMNRKNKFAVYWCNIANFFGFYRYFLRVIPCFQEVMSNRSIASPYIRMDRTSWTYIPANVLIVKGPVLKLFRVALPLNTGKARIVYPPEIYKIF